MLFTSESVTEGHPDKLCDQIADAILDEIIGQDPDARVACEVMTTTNLVLIAGEITTDAEYDAEKIARHVIRDVGYVDEEYGIKWDTCEIIVKIEEQSPDINRGIGEKMGAGDQGMMVGFACDETPEFMPLPIMLAHQLSQRLAQVRKQLIMPYLRPDGKSQVTVQYTDGKPMLVSCVVISAQHAPDISQCRLQRDMFRHVIEPTIPKELLKQTIYFINPTGRFVVGGPKGDTGLTGRKIMVDTYGGVVRHGGGAFSGKDPTKVDRTAAYALRHIAKQLVAQGYAPRLEIQAAYVIGLPKPISIHIETFGTSKVSDEELKMLVQEYDLRPAAIIQRFGLQKPIYRPTACYGHFGRKEFPWEMI